MSELYGSDFITIVDEDGMEYELEVLTTVEYNSDTYLAVIPAADPQNSLSDFQISILKSVDENGESILCAVEDEAELEAVHNLIMNQIDYPEDTY